MDSGNAAWMLTAASLVLLMTPAVAFFYGGLTRAKSTLNMMMLSVGALAVTSIVWILWGWSTAYGPTDIGGIFTNPFEQFALNGLYSYSPDDGAFTFTEGDSYPQIIDVAFQVTFAIITVALISGALADRVKYTSWLLFVALWITFDYAPLAHMVWGGGLLSGTGPISTAIGAAAHDFAGGTVVHINAGIASLVTVLVIGRRVGWPQEPMRGHNVPFVLLGAFLLWFGWFGFNAGSALAANGTAGFAWVTTTVATAGAILGWGIVEKIRDGKMTAVGAASGTVAGLVGITPAADIVAPAYAILLGLILGALCAWAVGLKFKFGYDDSLDVVGVHGVGGLTGTLLIGLFAAGTGLFNGGGLRQLLVQLIIAAIAIAWSGVITFIIDIVIDKTIGWRVSKEDEIAGIDFAEHGETAYEFTPQAIGAKREA